MLAVNVYGFGMTLDGGECSCTKQDRKENTPSFARRCRPRWTEMSEVMSGLVNEWMKLFTRCHSVKQRERSIHVWKSEGTIDSGCWVHDEALTAKLGGAAFNEYRLPWSSENLPCSRWEPVLVCFLLPWNITSSVFSFFFFFFFFSVMISSLKVIKHIVFFV